MAVCVSLCAGVWGLCLDGDGVGAGCAFVSLGVVCVCVCVWEASVVGFCLGDGLGCSDEMHVGVNDSRVAF